MPTLKNVKIKEVKPETRLLGISFGTIHGTNSVVGVVFKGKKSMDGIITATSPNSNLTSSIVQMVKESKYWKQIRVIILEQDKENIFNIDPFSLLELTGIPVLQLQNRRETLDLKFEFNWKNFTVISLGLTEQDARKILNSFSNETGIPEVLRISEIILKRLYSSF